MPGLLLALVAAAGSRPASSSEAFDLLDRTVAAYADLSSYRDTGEVIATTSGPFGSTTLRYETQLLGDGNDGFLLRIRALDGPRQETVVWREGPGWRQWSSTGGLAERPGSPGSVIASLLGPEAVDGALVPLLLARDTALAASPEAASLDGTVRCGDSLCDVLLLSLREGRSQATLWIDQATRLLTRVEVEVSPPATIRSPEAAVRKTLVFEHFFDGDGTGVSPRDVSFSPPDFPGILPLPGDDEGILGALESDLVVSEEISVALRALAVRALDSKNRPIPDLEPQDFEVRLGKDVIPVQSVDWISSRGTGLPTIDPGPAAPPLPLAPRNEADGNLIVLFIQSDFNAVRVKGHLRILPMVRDFLRALDDEDWVAVVSFDSHLKLWLDFSRDRQAAGDATEQAIRFGAEPPLHRGRYRSLAYSFPTDEARKAATPEDALRLTARSLLDIPGEKIIVYLGWGLGRYGSSGFRMTRDYDRALATLDAARTSVFVLDVTDADYHTLELGIRQVAEDTGGTYSKTDDFARREVMRLVETISGYYLLTLDRASLPDDLRKLELRLVERDGRVLLRQQQLRR